MIEPFSANYFLGHFHVYPTKKEQAAMDALEYAVLQDFYHGTGPLVMKLATHHFSVQGDTDVPLQSLAVPEAILEKTGIGQSPGMTQVFVAKNEQVAELLGF